MITAVLDTNVFIQALIGTPRSASARTLRALDDGRFQLLFCPSTIDELLDVLALPAMRDLHRLSDDAILRFVLSFLPDALVLPDPAQPPASLPRDMTDTKFLGLAAVTHADYLVTNDRRHLLRLEEYEGTRIVAPRGFLNELS